MKIIKVYLKGYKWLLLNQVNQFTYTPEDPIQLIIGSNGSGKSSVLLQLTPFPPERSDFKPGGQKVMEVEHRGRHYVLTTDFDKRSAKHSFVQDGLERNEGGTGSVQKELVLQEFGVDQGIHDLLLGKVKFTDLSPQLRREWLIKASGLELGYVTQLFKSIQSGGRDVQGARKLMAKRLVGGQENHWDDEKIEQTQKVRDDLERKITQLMEMRNNAVRSIQDIELDLSDVEKKLETCVSVQNVNLGGESLVHNEFGANTEAELVELLGNIREKRSGLESTRVLIVEMLEKHEVELTKLRSKVNVDVASLTKQLQELEKELETLPANYQFTWDNFDRSWKATAALCNSTGVGILNGRYAEDFDRASTHQQYTEGKERMEVLAGKIGEIELWVNRAQTRCKHIEEMKEEHCPSCGFEYVPGVAEGELERLRAKLEESTKVLSGYKEERKNLEELILQHETRRENRFEVMRWMKEFALFRSLWSEVADRELLDNKPTDILGLLEEFRLELDIKIKERDLEEEIQSIRAALAEASVEEGGMNRLRELEQENLELTSKLTSIAQELDMVNGQVSRADKLIRFSSRSRDAGHVLDGLIERIESLGKEFAEASADHAVRMSINDYQSKLAVVSRSLQEQETHKVIFDDLQSKYGELEDQEAAWKKLGQHLSPTEGLIAEQLMGFITSFTDTLNNVIGQVWNYDMTVQPCNFSNGNLDYKFPFSIKNSKAEGDVKDASAGQKDIINFAFTVATMAYLGMNDFPIYADELEKAMDETHRDMAGGFLKMMLTTNQCSQLIMISHAYAISNSLGSCQVCVLDDANITVPKTYNEHVIMA